MKKAILAVSYGTTYPEAIQSSIQAIEDTFRKAVPDYKVFRAFTGKRILDVLNQKGINIDSIEIALEKLVDARYDLVVVQPTHLMYGTEYKKIQETVVEYQERFQKIILGTPLLNTQEDIKIICQRLVSKFGLMADALVLAGHGSVRENTENLYSEIVRICRKLDYPDVYAAALEVSPTLEEILPDLRNKRYRSVAIIPLMVTAGKHTCRDFMGDGTESWKSRLERENFCVVPIMQGLGEYEEIRALYAEHLRKICGDTL